MFNTEYSIPQAQSFPQAYLVATSSNPASISTTLCSTKTIDKSAQIPSISTTFLSICDCGVVASSVQLNMEASQSQPQILLDFYAMLCLYNATIEYRNDTF